MDSDKSSGLRFLCDTAEELTHAWDVGSDAGLPVDNVEP